MRALVIILLLAVPVAAQVREAIEVRVIELETTVLDRSGKPVEGLTRDDFRVQAGRREVPITNFFAVRDGVILASDERRAGDKSVAAETSIPTSLVIFIDELHLRAASRRRALQALQRYVAANVGPQTTATIVRYFNHLDVLTRPTERPGYVINELEKLARSPVATESAVEHERMVAMIDGILTTGEQGASGVPEIAGESPDTIFYRLMNYAEHQVADVEATLRALDEAIELSSAFSGRRVLLYVSDGLPQTPALELFEYWQRLSNRTGSHVWRQDTERNDISQAMSFDRSGSFKRLAEKAENAGVAIYSFDAGGLRGYEGRGVEQATTLERFDTTSMLANQRAGLQYVAAETGGSYVANENDADKVLAQMNRQFTNYYSIGIAPQRGDVRITVRDRPDLRVITARRHAPRSRDEVFEQEVRRRLYTRAAENPLEATLGIGSVARVSEQCVLPLVVKVPRPKLVTTDAIDLQMIMLNEQNDESMPQRLRLPFTSDTLSHTMMLRVRPGKHVLSIGVANPLSGEASYAQYDVDATGCR